MFISNHKVSLNNFIQNDLITYHLHFAQLHIRLLVVLVLTHIFYFQLNFLVTENRQREIVDVQCEGIQTEGVDALLSVAIQCVSSSPEDRPTMHRVVQLLEPEVMTPCPSDFYDTD